MPTPNHFAFRIRKDPNNYYCVINGGVQLLPAPNNPDRASSMFDIAGPGNFKEEGIRHLRHSTYRGMGTTYSEALSFVENGLQIVEFIFYRQDIEAEAQLEVLRLNYDTYLYEPFFVGDIDFTTFDPAEGSIKINIKEGGATAMIKANENTPYEIPMMNSSAVYVNMDGIKLQGTYNYLLIASQPGAYPVLDALVMYSFFSAHTIDDGEFAVSINNDRVDLRGMASPAAATSFGSSEAVENYYLEAIEPMDIILDFNQKITVYNNALDTVSYHVAVDLIIGNKANMSFILREVLYVSPTIAMSGVDQRDVIMSGTSTEIHLNPGERVYMVFYYTGGSPRNTTVNYAEGALKVSSKFKLPTTIAPTFRYHTAFVELIDAMSEGKYSFRSDFLADPNLIVHDNSPWRTVITCGDALRMLAGSKMSLTLSDLFTDATNRWGLGLGVEGDVIRVEPLAYFYDKYSEIAYVKEDNITDFRIVPDIENRGNLLKIGQPDQDYDSLNGKDEVSGTYVFKLPFTRVNKEIDMSGGYRVDALGIEAYRVNLSKKYTTDNKADKELFVLSISDDWFENDGSKWDAAVIPVFAHIYYLLRPNNSSNTSGVLFPDELYNVDLWPKRSFLRNAGLIAAYCWRRDGQQITFQTYVKNQKAKSNLGSGEVIETGNESLPLSASPLFLPMLGRATCIMPDTFKQVMQLNPYGFIRLTWKGVDYRGFVNKGAVIDAVESSQELELQCHPESDFTSVTYL